MNTIINAETAIHATHENGDARTAAFAEPPLGGAVPELLGALLEPELDTVDGAENVNGSEIGLRDPGVLLGRDTVDDVDPDVEGALVEELDAEEESDVLCARASVRTTSLLSNKLICANLGGVGSSGVDVGFVGVEGGVVVSPVRIDDNGLFTILN